MQLQKGPCRGRFHSQTSIVGQIRVRIQPLALLGCATLGPATLGLSFLTRNLTGLLEN